MPRRLFVIAVVAAWSASICGCGGSSIDARVAALNKNHINKLYNCYSLFQQFNQYRAPTDEGEFKAFLQQGRFAKNLERMRIDSLDDIFVSERDGEPFKVRYGVNGLGNKAIIFESTGVDGKRMVAMQEPVEVDDAEYEAYWSGSKRPASGLPGQGPPPS